MKKKLLSVSFFLFTALLYAQIPTYYNDVNLNQTGTSLKDELSSKITTTQTTILSYTPSVWNALQQSDLDPTDTSKVLLIYGYDDNDGEFKTDRSRGVNNNGGGVGLWNREHVYPRSLGNPNLGSTGPGSDAHSLRPSDGQMNSSRSNRKFASGNGNSVITPQGNFYPGDEWKGDVARMMMYMYLRYGSRCLPSNVAVGNTVAGDANMIDILLQWNADDPVNGFEDNRNEVIAGIQGNRNPFVDNPAFATQIWGGPQAEDRFGMGVVDTEAPTVPLNLVASNTTSNSTVLNWTASTDNIGVTGYNVFQDGAFVVTVSSTTYNVSGLGASTGYSFSVNAIDAAGNASANSASAVVTTQSAGTGGTASELFISEYIEGSSNNKALEIANFTGSTVSLSGYSLRKATNGSGSFTSTYNLTGQLANGEVFVVANSSATSVILNEADATSGVTTFNGNDAIGLFKDNVIIDLMGDANSSANFAKDVTLRRKSSVLDPNTTYTVSEWDQFPQNTFDDLGSHTVDGGGPAPDTEAPSAPTNVVASNVTTNSATLSWSASTDNVGVTGYDIYQGSTLLASVTTTGYTVTGLSPSTNYMFNVRAKDAANNVSNASSSVSVTTDTVVLNYCNSQGNNTNYEFIDFVGLGGISNGTSANGGYGDFTNQTANISYGSNTIVVSAGFPGQSYTEQWRAWIDFNQNGTFESSEEIVSGSSSSSGNLSYNFTVPNSALIGNTRLRVSMKWNGTPGACETFTYGEVEDYTVNIGNTSARFAPLANITIDGELGEEQSVFKSTIQNTYNGLGFEMKDDRQVSYTVYNMSGRFIAKGKFSRKTKLSNLNAGIYIVHINDGQRTIQKKVIVK